ncbi:hypothetical protein DVH05_006524 [Phytophthora capsici]|nr:hypothetical protein DVH05_006524 [Phytophthora capsici]
MLVTRREQTATEKSKKDVLAAESDTQAVLDLTRDPEHETNTLSGGTTTFDDAELEKVGTTSKRFFRASEKTLNVLISKFLISLVHVLPYTVCASSDFHDFIRTATGNPAFQVLGRDRHDRLLNGQFQLFCDLCEFIAVLACVKNDGHNAPGVAKVIESACKARFNLDIRGMTRFTMSDTTPSAKNVADHIDAEQESCSMHHLNLCIGYEIGLKDNIQTTTVWNEETSSLGKIVTIVTPGGALREEGDVIRKLRNLNNHFKSSKQRAALKNIQEALSYPELEPMTDQDVRVAYTCKLIRRSVVNYSAFDAYFQSTKDSSSVWTALTAKDWMLAVKMEAATNFVAGRNAE